MFLEARSPGPIYPGKDLMGKNFNSRYKSLNGITMYSKLHDGETKEITPGPGQYQIFSEFGEIEE